MQDEESPDIEFQYDDADTHAAEIAEAYRFDSIYFSCGFKIRSFFAATQNNQSLL